MPLAPSLLLRARFIGSNPRQPPRSFARGVTENPAGRAAGFWLGDWERQFVASVLRRLEAKSCQSPSQLKDAGRTASVPCGLALPGAPVIPAPPPAPLVNPPPL